METWQRVLVILHVLSYVVLLGGLAWMVTLERWAAPEGWRASATIDRALRSTGAFLSVALATTIYTGLGLYYLVHGSFSWGTADPWQTTQLIKAVAFLVFWIHWGWTEVKTLDGLRRFTPGAQATEQAPEYGEAHRVAWRAMRLLLVEAVVISIIGAVGSTLA